MTISYYYYGHMFGCILPDDRNFNDAVNYAFTIHKQQCRNFDLVVDSRSKQLIIDELKRIYDYKLKV